MPAIRVKTTPAAFLLAAVSCFSDTAGPDGPTALLRLLNGSGTAPALEVVIEGNVVIPAVPTGASSAWEAVPASATVLELRVPGASAPIGTVPAAMAPGARYTLLAAGSMANLQGGATVDTGVARSDRANIRIVNVAAPFTDSASAPAPVPLDVHITAPGAALLGRQGELSMDARYPSYSSLLYFTPGTLMVRFTLPGTDQVVASTPALGLAAGQVRAVILERRSDGTFLVAVVAE